MSNDVDSPTAESGLLFYWYEIRPDEEASTWWGQLAGGMHRLITVREELEALRTQRNVEKAMRRLESHVESYLVRAYELRERALGLLASQTQQAKAVERLRHPKQRNDALSSLKLTAPELTTAVGHLLSLLDDDIGLRNLHTHQFYLNLGLFTGSDIFDPYDALLDLSDHPASRRQLEVRLRRGGRGLLVLGVQTKGAESDQEGRGQAFHDSFNVTLRRHISPRSPNLAFFAELNVA